MAAGELDRSVARAEKLAVLDLGVPDTPYGSARLALAARLNEAFDESAFPLVWSTRGAPHRHRWGDLAGLATALWPLSDADATARIASSSIKEGARLGLAAFTAAALAMRDVVSGPMAKGEVSTAVSARVPAVLTYMCRACQAQHISGALFQQVGLAAGVQLQVKGVSTTLAPIGGRPPVPQAAAGTALFVTTYLRLLGPATPGDVASFLGTTVAEARRAWPEELAEVRVNGRTAWLPASRVPVLLYAPRPHHVRLLPPGDPYLQARDRDLVVPDRARQKEIWRVLGNPGALLVNGEVAGVWRARMARKGRLDVTVTPFEPLGRPVRTALDVEARHLATARGATDLRTTIA